MFGLKEYTLVLNIDSLALNLLDTILLWFLPLCGILIVSSLIFVYLAISKKRKHKFNKNTKNDSNNKSVFEYMFNIHLGPQAVFTIMMALYWIQWVIPCGETLLSFIPNVVISSDIYWLTYTVCFTDAIILLVLNPNVSFLRRRLNRTSTVSVIATVQQTIERPVSTVQ